MVLNYLMDKVNEHDRALEWHDGLCAKVFERLHADGFHPKAFYSFDDGECDVFASNDKNDALVFEIKGHHSYKGFGKARKQLAKDEVMFRDSGYDRVFKFYVTYINNKVHYQRVL